MTIKKWLAPAGLAVVVGTVCACTTSGATAQSSEPDIDAIPIVRTGADIVLPFDAYVQTAEEQRAVTDAVIILGRDCMKRFRLTWPADQPPAGAAQPPNARRYWVIDPEKVKVEGYHPLDSQKRAKEVAAHQARQKKPTDDEMNVWAGRGERTFDGQPVPAGGCAGEAVRKLTEGTPAADPMVAQQLQLATFARTKGDSRVKRAFGEWSRCMRDQGFDYPDPIAAFDDQRWQTAAVSKQEITVATADVTCKTRGNVAGTMLAVETAYQKRAIEQHATELAAIRSYLDAQVSTANRVIAGGS